MQEYFTLIIFSLIIILGTFGEIFFKKTGIPDVLWLILFGFLSANVFGIINLSNFETILPTFMTITLIIILFEGGLNFDLSGLIKYSGKATSIAMLNLILTIVGTIIITGFLYLIGVFGEWNIWTGIILGGILGGTSSIVVLPMLNIASFSEDKKNMLGIESALTDGLTVVLVITLANYLSKGLSILDILKNITSSFTIAIIVGIIIGLVWTIVLKKLKSTTPQTSQYFYVLTISLIIFSYAFVEILGGSAVISTFIIGLIMGNSKLISKITNGLTKLDLYGKDKDIFLLNSQIAFLIKGFFFVIMGVLLKISFKGFIIAIIISATLLLVRYITINTIKSTKSMVEKERRLMYFFAPRGLAAGILSIQIATNYKDTILGSNMFVEIVFSVVLITILIATYGLFEYKRNLHLSK